MFINFDFGALAEDELSFIECPECARVGTLRTRPSMPQVKRCSACGLWLHPDLLNLGPIEARFTRSRPDRIGGGEPVVLPFTRAS